MHHHHIVQSASIAGERLEKAEVEDWEVFERKPGTAGKRQRTNRNNYHKIVSKNGCFQKKLLPKIVASKIVAPLRFEDVHTSAAQRLSQLTETW